jgi:hypothetical protein
MAQNLLANWDGIRVRYLRDLQNRDHNVLENRDALHCHPASAIDGIVGGVPSDTVVTETSYGQLPDAGIALTFSRGDHTHGTPAMAAYYNTIRITSGMSPYLVTAGDNKMICDATGGSIAITLPLASTHNGRELTIKKIDGTANTVTVYTAGGETIDNSSSKVISILYDSITINADTGNWWIT